jgi:multicomponent Na+:H+ antiporter subunit D
MNTIWLILPIIIPILTAVICLFGIALRPTARSFQRFISLVGSLALLAASLILLDGIWRHGIQVVQVGSWPMPFGITLVADSLSAIMVVLAGLIGAAVQVFALASVDPQRERFGFYPLYQVLLMGVCGAFLTGDLFNMYVWFEVMLMSSFVLMALGSGRGQTEGAIKYVTLNLISSAIFLAATGILYSVVGTLNMADLSVKISEINTQEGSVAGLINVIAILFLIAFGIKAAVFPLFFWLPDSYHTPPPAVSAVFAGLLTKVGVYALIRMFTLILPLNEGLLQGLMLWIAGLTMLTGVLGAVAQNKVRRILSFHIISQIGYMVMGLALFTPLALAGAVFYILHHVVVKTNLFLIGGLIERMGGTGDLKRLGGLYRTAPVLAVLFLIPALSLAGIPPLSGFFAKLSLIQAGLETEQFWLVGVALFVSLLTLYSMIKIWTQVFWKPEDQAEGEAAPIQSLRQIPAWGLWLAPILVLASVTLLVGFGAGVAFPLALRAGNELIDPSGYIAAVFGSGE